MLLMITGCKKEQQNNEGENVTPPVETWTLTTVYFNGQGRIQKEYPKNSEIGEPVK